MMLRLLLDGSACWHVYKIDISPFELAWQELEAENLAGGANGKQSTGSLRAK